MALAKSFENALDAFWRHAATPIEIATSNVEIVRRHDSPAKLTQSRPSSNRRGRDRRVRDETKPVADEMLIRLQSQNV